MLHPKHSLVQKKFGSNKFLGPKALLGQKIIWIKKFLYFVSKFLWV